MPGPGSHETEDHQFGRHVVGFAFQGKYKDKHNQNPGPGEYDRVDELTKTKIVTTRFGSSKR